MQTLLRSSPVEAAAGEGSSVGRGIVEHVRELIDVSPVGERSTFDAPETSLVNTDTTRVSLIVNHLLGSVAKDAPTGPLVVPRRSVQDVAMSRCRGVEAGRLELSS